MSTFTLTHDIRSTPRLTLSGLWHALRGEPVALRPTPTPVASGPLGQSEAEIYTRGMLGWRG